MTLMDMIIDRKEINAQLQNFVDKEMNRPHRLKVKKDNEVIWEYDGTTKTILPGPSIQTEEFTEIIDLGGETYPITSFSGSKDSEGVLLSYWKQDFVEKAKDHILIPDTNIIYKHYCSNILFPLLGEQFFKDSKFWLPRLTILEIELRCNNAKPKSKDKRLAFYATSEINFLKTHSNFNLLPLGDTSLVTSFPRNAGEKFADAWIRREIHEARQSYVWVPLFLTSDLMNALAAEAEGLECCYFATSSRESSKIMFQDVVLRLANLVIASAIIFGKIKLEMFLREDKPFRQLTLEGIWTGKTTSEWYSDSLALITKESTF